MSIVCLVLCQPTMRYRRGDKVCFINSKVASSSHTLQPKWQPPRRVEYFNDYLNLTNPWHITNHPIPRGRHSTSQKFGGSKAKAKRATICPHPWRLVLQIISTTPSQMHWPIPSSIYHLGISKWVCQGPIYRQKGPLLGIPYCFTISTTLYKSAPSYASCPGDPSASTRANHHSEHKALHLVGNWLGWTLSDSFRWKQICCSSHILLHQMGIGRASDHNYREKYPKICLEKTSSFVSAYWGESSQIMENSLRKIHSKPGASNSTSSKPLPQSLIHK